MDGIATRRFQNIRYPAIDERDFAGARVIMAGDHKLVVDGSRASGVELFNLRDDAAESRNLAASEPAVAADLEKRLREWQHAALTSLTGADYREDSAP